MIVICSEVHFSYINSNFSSVNIKNDEPFLQDGSATVLHVKTLGHVLHAYINGKLSGNGNQ